MYIYTLMSYLHWRFLSVHFWTYSVITLATLLPGMRWPCSFTSEDILQQAPRKLPWCEQQSSHSSVRKPVSSPPRIQRPSWQPLGCPAAGQADIPLYSLYHTSCRQQCFCNTTTPSAFRSVVVLGLISAFWIYCNVSWISVHTLPLSQCFPLLWAAHTSS